MEIQNWFGLHNGKLIGEPPAYVDKSKEPGRSMIPAATPCQWLQRAPFVLITSPNFVWACIALGTYYAFPYNFTTAATYPISTAFFMERFPLWFALVFGYDAFWHLACYAFNLANRPFAKNRVYNFDKVAHNTFWTLSGVAIWTLFENIMCYLWATQKLAYASDSFLTVGIALMAVPVWRSVHFYFAHRFLHFESMYRQVHSLHHRNTDVEPFSGLCMHPVEHLYYYACIAPSLLFVCSPFAFLWNGVHLLLSPGASHSGFEDHFQSDAFHYLHHRYFECNYAGTDAAFMDVLFGTFRGTLADTDAAEAREDAKSTLRSIPTKEFLLYLGGSAACVLVWYATIPYKLTMVPALAVSSLVGFGPVVLASAMSGSGSSATATPIVKGTAMNTFGNLLHTLVGMLFCSVPIMYMCYLAVSK
jgi:sterol desaturase/sphingolipid hydroxylase (fatty acid hydroxylase superfamily)